MIVEVFRNGRRYAKAQTFTTKREALDWEKKFLYEIDSGLITKESLKKRRVTDAIEKYITAVLPHKPRNAPNVIQHLGWWKDQIGALPLSEGTPAVISEYRDRLLFERAVRGKPRSNNTVIRYLASISIVFEYAVKEWLWMMLNPVCSIKKPKVGKGKTRFFDLGEIQIIKSACEKSKSSLLLPIFIIALHTGMRRGEILSLRWEDVDFKNRELHLPTSKNGEPRDVPMSDEVFRTLSDLALVKKADISGLVFSSPYDPRRPIDIVSAWRRVLKKAEIKGATFHTTRHTACSYLAQLGIAPILISRIVGHSDSKTTDRYTHAVKEHTRAAIGQLEALIEGKC
ncbi:MAG: site-specific integrase [Simkania sp.]|nr:site-specific integrase [Simkania sp.]